MTLSKSTFNKLKNIVGKSNISMAKEDLACYTYDANVNGQLPDAIVFPGTTEEVSRNLKLANREHFIVIPRGSGTGMTGGSIPLHGGVIVVMSRFNRILNIDKDNLVAYVEPGVITGHFQDVVEKQGLFYPPDPSSADYCTLGGNLAECAGGPRAVKYGVTRDYVLGIEAVLATGEIIHGGVQTMKGVVGYDLTRLLIGSEGTLGIITSMTLKLLPLPETVKTTTAVFDNIETAAQTVSEIIRCRIIPRTIEYMDNASIRCVERYLGAGLPIHAEAILIIEVDGRKIEIDDTVKQLKNICLNNGASSFTAAETEDEAANIWKARKAISPSLFTYGPDKINEDIVVPRNKIPDMVKKIDTLRLETGLQIVSFGHAGDGNIHFNIMLDKKNNEHMAKAQRTVESLFEYTIELGGTISGEHGIGTSKAPFLSKEIGQNEFDLMKRIKNLFDPNNILNPGKIFPD
jgi:glycolate oxidase